jgi:hypothetical protein
MDLVSVRGSWPKDNSNRENCISYHIFTVQTGQDWETNIWEVNQSVPYWGMIESITILSIKSNLENKPAHASMADEECPVPKTRGPSINFLRLLHTYVVLDDCIKYSKSKNKTNPQSWKKFYRNYDFDLWMTNQGMTGKGKQSICACTTALPSW